MLNRTVPRFFAIFRDDFHRHPWGNSFWEGGTSCNQKSQTTPSFVYIFSIATKQKPWGHNDQLLLTIFRLLIVASRGSETSAPRELVELLPFVQAAVEVL